MTFQEEVNTLKGFGILKAGIDGDGTLIIDVSDVPSEKMLHSILVAILEAVCRREVDRYMENGMDKETARCEAIKTIGAAFMAFNKDFKEIEGGMLS